MLAAESEHTFGIAPGMGRKSKVKVLLETEVEESTTEGSAYPLEAVGAARNRAQASRRKVFEPWVSQLTMAKPDFFWSAGCIGDSVRVKLPSLTSGELPASVATRVGAADRENEAAMGRQQSDDDVVPEGRGRRAPSSQERAREGRHGQQTGRATGPLRPRQQKDPQGAGAAVATSPLVATRIEVAKSVKGESSCR